MKYVCLEPIDHDLERHEVGSEVTLTDEQAAPLLLIGHVSAVVVKKAKGARQAAADAAPDGEAPGAAAG